MLSRASRAEVCTPGAHEFEELLFRFAGRCGTFCRRAVGATLTQVPPMPSRSKSSTVRRQDARPGPTGTPTGGKPAGPTIATPLPRATATRPLPWWRRTTMIRVAGAWLLAGACAKAFTGTPAELPAPILATELDPFVVITAAVVVETIIALLAIFAPRVGWPPLAALLALFVGILGLHLRSGAESCGCFGGALAIPAWLVLAVDAALLAAVLLARPWTWRPMIAPGAAMRTAMIASSALACGLVLGWIADARLDSLRPVEAQPMAVQPTLAPVGASGASGTSGAPAASSAPPVATTTVASVAAPWRRPDVIPDQVILRPLQWIGKRLAETELGRWTDTSSLPGDATLIIYYKSCNHCAAHLRQLAEQQAAAPASSPTYVMVQLPTPAAYTGRLFVDRVPEGTLVELPAAVKTWVITPPWNVVVKGGVVSGAERVKWSGEK